MARKIYYKILDEGGNKITDEEWEGIAKLQHWYNSEFMWTAGKIALKMYAVFPNIGHYLYEEDELWQRIVDRRKEMRELGLQENEIIRQLESEGLIIAKKGGYFDGCIASGFTRVAANEWNAYLVCEFLLKASLIALTSTIIVEDEGEFIKPKTVFFQNGNVILLLEDESKSTYYKTMIAHRHVFSIVDPAKYDHFPVYKTMLTDFKTLDREERRTLVKDLNWLGFENNFDVNGDDVQGVDLNKKVSSFELNTTH